jgi:hypothetical protein
MVAGCRLWGHHEKRATQHQPRRCGDLGVEAVVENRLGAGEAGGRGTDVQSTREVDEEDDREAEQAQGEDDPAQPAPSLVAQGEQGECGGEQGDGDQEVGVRLTGGPGAHRRRAGRRQAGVARLADFNCPVVDELGGDQAAGRGDDGQADRPPRRQHGAGAGRGSLRPGGESKQALFKQGQAAKENYGGGAQAAGDAPGAHPQRMAHPDKPWPGTLEAAVDGAIELGAGRS